MVAEGQGSAALTDPGAEAKGWEQAVAALESSRALQRSWVTPGGDLGSGFGLGEAAQGGAAPQDVPQDAAGTDHPADQFLYKKKPKKKPILSCTKLESRAETAGQEHHQPFQRPPGLGLRGLRGKGGQTAPPAGNSWG